MVFLCVLFFLGYLTALFSFFFAFLYFLQSYGNGLDADGVKLYCAPMAKRVADRAIQVLGGNGYMGQYQVERLWRDSKLLEIGGGTNEAHHKNMARDIKRNHTKIL
jgi:isovaleryl-CoA dehydrogenase